MPTVLTPSTVLAISTVQSVGAVITVLTLIGFAVYVIVNVVSGREEAGSELELAPNRKPYYDDDKLETTKLNRTLASGVLLLGLVSVGLPLYWLAEPGRQEGAQADSLRKFIDRGREQYETGSQCVNCHGPDGTGGQAAYTVTDANGSFVASLQWRAPALNTALLRFSRDELAAIIDQGRPGTPMPGWGATGGGPRTTQQIDNLVDYLQSVQITYKQSRKDVETELAERLGFLDEKDAKDPAKVKAAVAKIDYKSLDTGKELFNLGREDGFASGAYSCGRCHTRGWSMITEGKGAVLPASAINKLGPYNGYRDGAGGGYAYTLDDLVPRKFSTVDDLADFVGLGSEFGVAYGNGGLGNGRMPGFLDNPNTEANTSDGMYTQAMVCAVSRYASTLQGDQPPLAQEASPAPTVPTTTTTAPPGTTETTAPPTPPTCSDEALKEASK
jgi:mono/diheme cytochrome c family protein